MTLYRSDWKPSDVWWDSWYWAKWIANGVLGVLHVTEWDEVYDDRGNLYKIDDLVGIIELGPRIETPSDDVSGVIRIPVVQRGEQFAADFISARDDQENEEFSRRGFKFWTGGDPDRIVTITARIPVPAPQPDIEVEGEVEP